MADFEDFDIMGNIKTIDNYKNYLLSSVADLFTTMGKGHKADMDEVVEELAEIVILSYLLGKRLGQDFTAIDERVIKKLKLGMLEGDNSEKEYQDYSKLIEYIRGGREK